MHVFAFVLHSCGEEVRKFHSCIIHLFHLLFICYSFDIQLFHLLFICYSFALLFHLFHLFIHLFIHLFQKTGRGSSNVDQGARDEARAHRQDEGAPDDTRLSSKVTTSASLEEGSQRWAHAWRTQGINVCLPLVPLVGCAALWSITLLCSVPLPSGVGSRKAKGGQ